MVFSLLGRVKGALISGSSALGSAGGAASVSVSVRYFSKGKDGRKRGENLRKINPRVNPQEASSIARTLYDVIKQHAPLTISNAWLLAKDSGVSGLNSKTHMKLMLKWMRGRKMLKLWCDHVGSAKKFLLSTLPEDPKPKSEIQAESQHSKDSKLQTKKKPSASLKRKAPRKKKQTK